MFIYIRRFHIKCKVPASLEMLDELETLVIIGKSKIGFLP